MTRFTIRLYSDFGMVPQDKTKILFESDSLDAVIDYINGYFKYENYFNAIYFVDNKLNKSGYVGRDLTINCGESLFTFCELPDTSDTFNKENFGTEVYTREDIQKLIDICFACVLVATDDRNYKIKNGTNEEKAAWVAEQLRLCGYDTMPMGSSWGILKDNI